jgi:hypothetical protein
MDVARLGTRGGAAWVLPGEGSKPKMGRMACMVESEGPVNEGYKVKDM